MKNFNFTIEHNVGDVIWRISDGYAMEGVITKIHMKFEHKDAVFPDLKYTVETRDAEFVYTDKLPDHQIYATKEDLINSL